MKRNWWQNRSVNVSAVIFSLLIFFHWTGILAPVETFFLRGVSPIAAWFNGWGANINERYGDTASRQDLLDELKTNKDEIGKLLQDNARLHEVEAENQILRQQLNFFSDDKYDYVVAQVVSRAITSLSPSERNKFIINKGRRDGLRENLVVVNEIGLVVGRITALKDAVAEVSLLIDKNCRLAVAVQNEEGVAGIAQGETGLTAQLDYIPQTKTIAEGQVVVTAGLESDVPSGLVIGRISQVKKSANELWQQATIEPSADLENIKIVSVIVPPLMVWQ